MCVCVFVLGCWMWVTENRHFIGRIHKTHLLGKERWIHPAAITSKCTPVCEYFTHTHTRTYLCLPAPCIDLTCVPHSSDVIYGPPFPPSAPPGPAEGPSFYSKGHVSGKWKQTSKITSHFALLTWPTLLYNANVCEEKWKLNFVRVLRWCLRLTSKPLCERNLCLSGWFADESVCSIDRMKSRKLENLIPLLQSASLFLSLLLYCGRRLLHIFTSIFLGP